MTSPHASNLSLDAKTLPTEEAFRQEWLVTNGLGGYASASIASANTRRYHGLLVAAMNPPVGRAVLLSKLEETLEVTTEEGHVQNFPLSSNLYPGTIFPEGHRSLESWTAYPAPTWVWSPCPGLRIEKQLWMAQGQNTTYVSYRLLEMSPEFRSARLSLVPLLAWKDYHSEMHATSPAPPILVMQKGEGVEVQVVLPGIPQITTRSFPLDLWIAQEDGTLSSQATFEEKPDWYYRFQHPREAERGLECEEDLFTPGIFSIPLSLGEAQVFHASLAEAEVELPSKAWSVREERQAALLAKVGSDDAFVQLLTLAADSFVVEVPGGRSTVIAGYPWFADWGRDTMISLSGLCLSTGRSEIARDILLSFAAYLNQGMLPNRFPDVGETPEYNTVDATLWYFVAIYRYWEATRDITPIQAKLWGVLEDIIQWHRQGTRYNIRVDPTDNLLFAGMSGVQLTWMDAKVGDWVVTPRIGKPVEINALWHAALRIMAHFAGCLGKPESVAFYTDLANRTQTSFQARFPRSDGRGLYDVLDTPDNDSAGLSIRPNQVFALSLPFAPLEPSDKVAEGLLTTVTEELLTPCGLRTLSPHDPAYRPCYEGDPWNRDGAYHQGTVWPWLLGPLAEAHYKVHGDSAAASALLEPLQQQLSTYGVGSLAEIFDGEAPHRPNGCIAQAWSVAETLRVLLILKKETNHGSH